MLMFILIIAVLWTVRNKVRYMDYIDWQVLAVGCLAFFLLIVVGPVILVILGSWYFWAVVIGITWVKLKNR